MARTTRIRPKAPEIQSEFAEVGHFARVVHP
jgi:hypothetical protein